MSGGAAGYPQDGQEMWELLEKADRALYYSKHHGHNRITHASGVPAVETRKGFLILLGVTIGLMVVSTVFYQFIRPNIPRARTVIAEKTRAAVAKTAASVSKVEKKVEEVVKMPMTQAKFDVVILNDGTVLKGRIIREADGEVLINLQMGEGYGTLALTKSEIKEIKYRSAPPEGGTRQ